MIQLNERLVAHARPARDMSTTCQRCGGNKAKQQELCTDCRFVLDYVEHEHGTWAAIAQHRRAGEDVCGVCLEGQKRLAVEYRKRKAQQARERRAKQKVATA